MPVLGLIISDEETLILVKKNIIKYLNILKIKCF